MSSRSAPGIIYSLHPFLLMSQPAPCGEMPYVPVGWQPFPRPEEQRANAIRLKPGEDFAKSMYVTKYRFQHSRSQSKRIYEEFEGGDKLMPADDLAEFAEQLQTKVSFPQSTLDQAFHSYGQRKKPLDTEAKRQGLMNKAGITLEEQDSFTMQEWSFKKETFDAEILRMLGKVRTRVASYLPG